MRRLVMTAALACALAAPATAAAAPAGSARLLSCESALDPADRAAVFEGRMRRVRGATRLLMRFTLQSRTRDQSSWHALAAPGFGRWLASGRSISPTCRQLDLRPDVHPLGIEARAGADAAHARYVVPVVNRGK